MKAIYITSFLVIVMAYFVAGVLYHQMFPNNQGFPLISDGVTCVNLGTSGEVLITDSYKGGYGLDRLLGWRCLSNIQPDKNISFDNLTSGEYVNSQCLQSQSKSPIFFLDEKRVQFGSLPQKIVFKSGAWININSARVTKYDNQEYYLNGKSGIGDTFILDLMGTSKNVSSKEWAVGYMQCEKSSQICPEGPNSTLLGNFGVTYTGSAVDEYYGICSIDYDYNTNTLKSIDFVDLLK